MKDRTLTEWDRILGNRVSQDGQDREWQDVLVDLYEERNFCIAMIASTAIHLGWNVGIRKEDNEDPVVVVDSPLGQMSWNISSGHWGCTENETSELFCGLRPYLNRSDRHSVEDRHDRIWNWVQQHNQSCAVWKNNDLEPAPPTENPASSMAMTEIVEKLCEKLGCGADSLLTAVDLLLMPLASRPEKDPSAESPDALLEPFRTEMLKLLSDPFTVSNASRSIPELRRMMDVAGDTLRLRNPKAKGVKKASSRVFGTPVYGAPGYDEEDDSTNPNFPIPTPMSSSSSSYDQEGMGVAAIREFIAAAKPQPRSAVELVLAIREARNLGLDDVAASIAAQLGREPGFPPEKKEVPSG